MAIKNLAPISADPPRIPDENLSFGKGYNFNADSTTSDYASPAPIGGKTLFNNFATPSAPVFTPSETKPPSTFGAGTALGTIIAPGVGTIVGSIIDAGVSLYGMYRQKKADETNREQAERWAAIQNEIAKKENVRQWKWLEEERDYQYANDFQKGIWNMMSMDVQMKDHLAQLYRRAA